MARVFIGVGHGGTDPGAVGYLIEKDVNLKMAKACYDYLRARGIDTQISRTGDATDRLVSKIDRCNAFAPDFALDIHNNAGGGDGFEIFHSVVGGKGKELAKNIEKEIVKIGQNSRGIKTKKNSYGRDYFGFIRSTKCPAVICEGVFVDNRSDAAQADTDAECCAFGEAYARGILATLGIADVATEDMSSGKPAVTPGRENPASGNGTTTRKGVEPINPQGRTDKNDYTYRVRVTANGLNIRKDAGISHAVTGVIRDKGVYTIVAEKTVSGQKWGKLKSGAGWICLGYTQKV